MSKLKLNLGCGKNPISGYVNVDIVEYPGVNFICDITNMEYKFPPNSCEEIIAKDVIEHFNIKDVYKMLKSWSDLLVVGGRIVLEFPDATEHCRKLISGEWTISKFNYQFFSEREPGQKPGEDWNLHKSAYNDSLITDLLNNVGMDVFKIDHFETPSTYNMRVVGVKRK